LSRLGSGKRNLSRIARRRSVGAERAGASESISRIDTNEARRASFVCIRIEYLRVFASLRLNGQNLLSPGQKPGFFKETASNFFRKTLARRTLIGKIVKAFRVAEEATGSKSLLTSGAGLIKFAPSNSNLRCRVERDDSALRFFVPPDGKWSLAVLMRFYGVINTGCSLKIDLCD